MKVNVKRTTVEKIELPNGYFQRHGMFYCVTDDKVTTVSKRFCNVSDVDDLSTNTIADLLLAEKSTEEEYLDIKETMISKL